MKSHSIKHNTSGASRRQQCQQLEWPTWVWLQSLTQTMLTHTHTFTTHIHTQTHALLAPCWLSCLACIPCTSRQATKHLREMNDAIGTRHKNDFLFSHVWQFAHPHTCTHTHTHTHNQFGLQKKYSVLHSGRFLAQCRRLPGLKLPQFVASVSDVSAGRAGFHHLSCSNWFLWVSAEEFPFGCL